MTVYVVSRFEPSTKEMRAHWFDVLATKDKAKAESVLATLDGKGRIMEYRHD